MKSIFLNALPKSGSDYIRSTLAENLQLKPVSVSGGIWPNKVLARHLVECCSDDALAVHDHLYADHFNRLVLNRYVKRLIIHVRDPRQATLSWVHHLQRRQGEDSYEMRYFDLDDEYFSLPLEKQIDVQIQKHFPRLVRWLESWIDANKDSAFNPQILFTSYENFRGAPQQFFDELFKFCDVECGSPLILKEPVVGDLQYRKGELDEWRRAFTPEQQNLVSSMLPEALRHHFGWQE